MMPDFPSLPEVLNYGVFQNFNELEEEIYFLEGNLYAVDDQGIVRLYQEQVELNT